VPANRFHRLVLLWFEYNLDAVVFFAEKSRSPGVLALSGGVGNNEGWIEFPFKTS